MPGLAQPDDRSFNQKADGAQTPGSSPGDPPEKDPKPFPGLEEKEFEAALQLLVDRAQYITGATGTALALPHGDEMVCRASAGSCAPAIGARLQVRSGLTGESISRRQLLRCDNAETDPRVNLETCRALGIASIIVLPLLRRNGEVRGLFELFSDHPYAFEERDLTALERMAELTQTALDLAEQRHGSVPPRAVGNPPDAKLVEARPADFKPAEKPAPAGTSTPVVESPPVATPGPTPIPTAPTTPAVVAAATPTVSPAISPQAGEALAPTLSVASPVIPTPQSKTAPSVPATETVEGSKAPLSAAPATSPVSAPAVGPVSSPAVPAEIQPAVASVPEAEATGSGVVPEAMRRVQKCTSCGFPVSEGRTFCLDCEKKQRPAQPVAAKPVPTVKEQEPLVARPLSAVNEEVAEDRETEERASPAAHSEEVLPPFLANAAPVKESWLTDHVNLLAIIVLILGILVAVVVFR